MEHQDPQDPQDPTQTQVDEQPVNPDTAAPEPEYQPEPVEPDSPTPDSGLQTPLPDQPIETPQPEPTTGEDLQHGVTGLGNLQPDEQAEQPQVQDESPTQRSQRLDTRNRVSSLDANQLSEHERREAERDAAREEHNRRVATPFDK